MHLQSQWTTEAPLAIGDRLFGRVVVRGQDERRLLAPLSEAWVQILADAFSSALAAHLLSDAAGGALPSRGESSAPPIRSSQ